MAPPSSAQREKGTRPLSRLRERAGVRASRSHDDDPGALQRARPRSPLRIRSRPGEFGRKARRAAPRSAGLSRRIEAQRLRPIHGDEAGRATARSLRLRRSRARQDDADGRLLRRSRGRVQAARAFPRLHGRRARAPAPMAAGAQEGGSRGRGSDSTRSPPTWRARPRSSASTSSRCATSPMR